MSSSSINWGGGGGGGNEGDAGGSNNVIMGGPCGACKFLRRKCVKGCVFAPYFQLDQGAAHFAAVHKVFGASNASKMLLSIPPHKRLDAVVSMCYEALARVRDPVYGCVAQIFSLQQQVMNLQAEVSYTQARLATVHHRQQQPYPPPDHPMADFEYIQCGSLLQQQQQQGWSADDMASTFVDQGEVDDGDDEEEELESFARQLLSKHLSSEFEFRPPTTSP
ncbi:unnamed protein product [Rhodiola kirilowii]